MKQVLGLAEINELSTTVVAVDTVARAVNIHTLEIENTKGLGYMTIRITRGVGAVNAAVNAGERIGAANNKPISWKVIPRPSDYTEQAFCCPEPSVPPSPPVKEAQGETGTGKTRGTMRENPETAGEPGPDGGQVDSVREEMDLKGEPQAEVEQPSEGEDFRLAGEPKKVSRRASAAKGTDTARPKNS